MQHGFTYASTLAASHKAHWRIEDLIGGNRSLDFNRPFLPETLAGVAELDFLGTRKKRLLNQIRGHSYLYLFGLVEAFILLFVLDHARHRAPGKEVETQALLGFAAEETKHIELFASFRRHFLEGFGTSCAVIGPAEAVAREVLRHHPLAVALVILHIEWMTQRHYLDSVHGDKSLDPCFSDLLKFHWMEEAQHAKLDTLMVEDMARQASPAEVEVAIDGYLAIIGFIAAGLRQQVEFDLASFETAAGRQYDEGQRDMIRSSQLAAMNWTFLGSGMTHPMFCSIVGGISRPAEALIQERARAYC